MLAKSDRKMGEKELDWMTTYTERRNFSYSASAMEESSTSPMGVDSSMRIDKNWLHMIWCELLCSDLGYCKIPLSTVRLGDLVI